MKCLNHNFVFYIWYYDSNNNSSSFTISTNSWFLLCILHIYVLHVIVTRCPNRFSYASKYTHDFDLIRKMWLISTHVQKNIQTFFSDPFFIIISCSMWKHFYVNWPVIIWKIKTGVRHGDTFEEYVVFISAHMLFKICLFKHTRKKILNEYGNRKKVTSSFLFYIWLFFSRRMFGLCKIIIKINVCSKEFSIC